MRSRKSFLGVSLCLVLSLVIWLVGCGSDSSTGTNRSLSGPEYQAVTAEANLLVDTALTYVSNGLATVLTTNDNDVDIRDMNAIAGLFYGGTLPEMSGGFIGNWLVTYGSDVSASGTRFFSDSLAYWDQGEPMNTSAGADRAELRHYSELSVDDTATDYSTYQNSSRFDFYDVDTDIATVGGRGTAVVSNKTAYVDSTVWQSFNISATFTNMVLDRTQDGWDLGCPTSGNCTGTVQFVHALTEVNADTVLYEFEITFNNGTASVQFTKGHRRDGYDVELCDLQPGI